MINKFKSGILGIIAFTISFILFFAVTSFIVNQDKVYNIDFGMNEVSTSNR